MDQFSATLPTKEQFQKQIDTTFHAVFEDDPGFDLQLLRIDSTISNSVQEAYSLIFHAPLDIEPKQGTHRMTHDELGEFHLFIVPIKQKEDGYRFEAVFNLLVAK